MSETKTPGLVAKHAIVTDTCRANRGDEGAIDEALARLRAEALTCMPAWAARGARFHFVLTVEPAATRDISGADIHVLPIHGPKHEESAGCWCNPERDSEEPSVVIHRVVS